MSQAKSQAQLQREYRGRLRRKDPELLRARDHKKYIRRCLKRQTRTNVSVRGGDSVPYHNRARPVNVELRQHTRTRNTEDKNSARKLYPIDETIYNKHDERPENRLRNPDTDVKNTESSVSCRPTPDVSVKYPICHLLRWLENVEDDNDVKYDFLKYIYGVKGTAYNNGRPDEYNTRAADDERRGTNYVQFHYSNERKRIPVESSSESETHHEDSELTVIPLRRKSTKKTTKATKRKNMNITWEPLCFDTDESISM